VLRAFFANTTVKALTKKRENILMHDSTINSNTVQQKQATPESLTPRSSGSPIYIANFTIDVSKIKIEILRPSGSNLIKEFTNFPEDAEEILFLFHSENVKGVRLIGKKKDSQLYAEWLLRNGIRPLITNQKKSKHPGDDKLEGIPVLNEYVAGIDIGKSLLIVAVPPHLAEDHTRAFGTFTDDLEEIVKWLVELKITEVAMESTSVYWIPLYDLCERYGIKPIIVNPKHVKMLPGRKTDVLDARWLMRLLACGLLRGGFMPALHIRPLRDLTRYRQDLIDRAGDCLNHMHKMLALMNIQLSNVLSDISGKSGTAIIQAIVNGERDTQKMAALVDKNCKSTPEEIARALHGTYDEGHIFVLKQELAIYEFLHDSIVKTECKIKEMIEKLPDIPSLPPIDAPSKRIRKKSEYNRSPYCFDIRSLIYRKFGFDLTVVSGIDSATAAVITFETGGNLEAFPTSKHFASWTGVCPGNKISGGKVISGKAPKKFSRVGQAMRIAANANHNSDSATGAHLRRLIRNGKTKKSARKATAHKICIQVYNMMKHGQEYVEKGAAEYEKAYEERKILNCIKTLKAMGYDCSKIKKTA
jgi:transposase